MSFSNYTNTNNHPYYFVNFRQEPTTAATMINKPIQKVETVINNAVDTFVKQPKNEEEKKSNKTAITAASSVFVITALAALLNPKVSGKLVNKLKTMSSKASAKAAGEKDNIIQSKFFKGCTKVLDGAMDIFQFTNSLNAGKDQAFKWLYDTKKSFSGIKNKTAQSILQCMDSGVRKVLNKPCQMITNWFDIVGKKTVFSKYEKASQQMDKLENVINLYKQKLPFSEQRRLEAKLKEIKTTRTYFSKNQTSNRLKHQEEIMSNLESDFNAKFMDFFSKFKMPNNSANLQHDKKHLKNNMSFWAEDILMPKRNIIEQEGIKSVDKLMGNSKDVRGKYNEVLDILEPHLSDAEKKVLTDKLTSTSKKLRNANHSECIEYFDKKRDLVLGGAPTDILTNVGLLGLSGIAISAADNKEDRVKRALTLGFPALAGIGTSITLTAMLFSGVQAMLLGSGISAVFSRVGSSVNKAINPASEKEVKIA